MCWSFFFLTLLSLESVAKGSFKLHGWSTPPPLIIKIDSRLISGFQDLSPLTTSHFTTHKNDTRYATRESSSLLRAKTPKCPNPNTMPSPKDGHLVSTPPGKTVRLRWVRSFWMYWWYHSIGRVFASHTSHMKPLCLVGPWWYIIPYTILTLPLAYHRISYTLPFINVIVSRFTHCTLRK